MSALEVLAFPIIFLGVAVARAGPRLCVHGGRLSLLVHDSWFHLLLADAMRASGHRVPRRIPGFLLSTHVAYPPLLHYLLSFAGRRARERLEPWLGGICDGLTAVVIYAVAAHGLPGGTPAWGWGATLLYTVTPGMLGVGWGPRALHGTPRVFGQLLFAGSSCCFLLHRGTGNILWMGTAILIGSLIVVASRFTAQVFVLGALLLAVILHAWSPLVWAGASLALSFVWFGGYARQLVKGHLRSLWMQAASFRRGRFDDPEIQQRNQWRDLFGLPWFLLFDRNRARKILLQRNTFLLALIQMPLLPAYLLLRPSAPSPPWLQPLEAFLLAGAILFLLTSLRPFLFLGEAERYLEHVVPLACVALGAFARAQPGGWTHPGMLALAAFSTAVYIALGVDFIRRARASTPRESTAREVLDWITRHAPEGRFAVLPRSNMNLLIPYFTSGQTLFGQWARGADPDILALRDPASPAFARCRDALFARFDTHFVLTTQRARNSPGIAELFAAYPVVWENQLYAMLAARPVGAATKIAR
ncbi:MAG TPA: hypothetical protein PKE12_08335 [Kiritimatiellia bacterium]|nr:hypothetical protein [Kiritimatiellia bacterium]